MMLSKKQFLDDIEAGWKTLGFIRLSYQRTQSGKPTVHINSVKNACAIGAAAYNANCTPSFYIQAINIMNNHDYNMYRRILNANDSSKTKEIALAKIKKIIYE